MTDNYEYDDYVDERGGSTDFGGPLLVPLLIFLIIACFCGQSCLLIHLNCSDMFIRALISANKVLIDAKEDDEHTEVHDKNNLDLSITKNSDVPPINETFAPPKIRRMSRRNSM
jgi:hypothetical protein